MSSLKGIDLVYQLIDDDLRRPELINKVWRRIHRSALNWHRADDWKRDLVEGEYIFDDLTTAVPNSLIANTTGANSLFMNWAGQVQSTQNIQVIDLAKLSNFRKIAYLRKYQSVSPTGSPIYDPTTGQQGTVVGGDLTERSADSMFDGYGYDKTDVFYRSGNTICINSSTPLDKVYYGYFRDPIVDLGVQDIDSFRKYASWIIDNYPGLIVADVKARMFTDTGKVEEANSILRPITGELYVEEMRLRIAETKVSLR